MDKLDTTYTKTNLDLNHVFRNYNENSDGSEKYTPYAGVYLSNFSITTMKFYTIISTG